MKTNKPLVSVVMSVRNGELYLKQAIESILRQSYKNIEIILINDASSDHTDLIVSKIKDSRIKVIKNKKRLGLTRSLNIGLSNAKGKYIARMDADDISAKNRLSKQVAFLEKNPDYGVVGSQVDLISSDNKKIGRLKFPENDNQIKAKLPFYNPFRHPVVLFRKKLIENYGLYDPKLDGAEDYDLWLRFSPYTKYKNLPLNLLKYRIHDKRVSTKEENKVLKSAIYARIKAIKNYGYGFELVLPTIISSLSILMPAIIKNTIRKLVRLLRNSIKSLIYSIFRLIVLLIQKTTILTSLGMRLVKYTNKYPDIVHPKHLTQEGREWFLKFIDKSSIVLDIGCNNGQNTIKAAKAGKQVIGFDFDDKLLTQAKKDITSQKIRNIRLLKHNAEKILPFKDNRFNVVLFFAVLEHLKKRDQALNEVARVLKPGGILLLSVPHSGTKWKRIQKMAHLSYFADSDHKIEFTKISIIKLLQKNHFKIIKISPVSFDMPFVGVIDLIGGISLTLYKIISLTRRKLVYRYPNETVSFEIAAKVIKT